MADPLAAALRDLVRATTAPIDRPAQLRWWAHADACRAEGLCPLTGEPFTSSRHDHCRDGHCLPEPEPETWRAAWWLRTM
jgi:hypothetical protein